MRVVPMDAPFGAFVHDPDPAGLREALDDHHLLCIRGREISDDEHLALARGLGRIAGERSGAIGIVSNTRADGTLGADEATWHSDYTFFPHPYECISLYAMVLPSTGTQTRFADSVLAARTLPDDLKRRLEGLQSRAVAVIEAGMSLTGGVRYRKGRADDATAHQLRPVLWPHPRTGEQVLSVWEQQTDAILPLPQDASVALLEELFAHLYQPAHVYVHDWQLHDLVLWDNLALQHSRPEVGATEERTLRRVCVGENQDISIFLNRASA